MSVSIIIPTFNGASRIGNCIDALLPQTAGRDAEILVVDDGSSDGTGDLVSRYASVHLITQVNAGPAAARNRGALEAAGSIILFTDDDCVPNPDWLAKMTEPFADPEIVGVKGGYRTRQRALVARFVQAEYEDRYHRMEGFPNIDFVDTYSAAFRRDRFLEIGGYDTSFPVACAEDIELSYRMSERGWKMKFVPTAIVFHAHPATFWLYMKKKYKFAFWRMLALRKNPKKALKDSHTPQIMKVQLMFAPALLLAICCDLVMRLAVPAWIGVCIAFLLSTLPFAGRAVPKDPLIGILSPGLLAARACAQGLGVTAGVIHLRRKSAGAKTEARAKAL